MLLLCFPALAVLFALTSFTARVYHARKTSLAEEWASRGNADLKAGRAEQAVEEFQTALVYSRENFSDQFLLAEALVESNRLREAQAYLLALWEREPGRGTVNLELGRLAARQGDVPEVLRYYNAATYGEWESNPDEHRRHARLELAQFLLTRHRSSQAQATLVALANELPHESTLHTQVGNLLLEAGDYDHALREFQAALRNDHNQGAALAGAGEAAFRMAEYRQARRYLSRAAHENPRDVQAARLLEVTERVLTADPFESGLLAKERSRRIAQAYNQAVRRLQTCAASRGESLEVTEPRTALQLANARAQQMRTRARESFLRRNPDEGGALMDWVFDTEELTARECGAPSGKDEALLLVARMHK